MTEALLRVHLIGHEIPTSALFDTRDGSVQVMSIFVVPARAALICTKATGEAGYFRAFSPT